MDNSDYDREIPIFFDISQAIDKDKHRKPFDVVITMVDVYDTPTASLIYSGKSIFGSKNSKLYVVFNGWGGGRRDIFEKDGGKREKIDQIDGIFCPDDLAKRILQHSMPYFPENKILATGTPVIDNLELDKVKEYRDQGRRKLNLEKDEIAILYLGDTSNDYDKIKNIDRCINEKTNKITVEAIIDLAKRQPERKFVLLLRPHPRDPNKDELMQNINIKTPESLRIVPATENISIQEAVNAGDVVISIGSIENFVASLRGKLAIFLGYKPEKSGKYLGGKVLEKSYGKEMMRAIQQDKNLDIVSSPEDLVACLKDHSPPAKEEKDVSESKVVQKSSVEKILDIALSDKKN